MECKLKEEYHCHSFEGACLKLIEDCEDHYNICIDECHSECACQDIGG